MDPITLPLTISVEDDVVLIDGPGIAISMAPEQAAITADRLLFVALACLGKAQMRGGAQIEIV